MRPISRSNCIFNIRKCLDLLKNQKRMSRKWLWRCDKIYERDFMSCIGLLEDLHRFADGLPKRSEKNYYKDGPYIVFNARNSEDKMELPKKVVRSGNFNKVIMNQLNRPSNRAPD